MRPPPGGGIDPGEPKAREGTPRPRNYPENQLISNVFPSASAGLATVAKARARHPRSPDRGHSGGNPHPAVGRLIVDWYP